MPSMRAGSYHDGELWLRCPYCGDSEAHKNKAHFSINTAGIYHCFRCSRSGKLPMAQLINLYAKADLMDVVLKEDLDLHPENFKTLYEELSPGPASSRFSALDRFHLKGDDVFLSRRSGGELVGLGVVGKNHTRRVVGNRAFGFKGDEILSSPNYPIRLVEGPYDVLSAQDVCVYGSISVKHLRALKAHVVILCPDGDVWTDERKFNSLLRCLWLDTYNMLASIAWIERLEDDKDPDEVPYSDRLRLSSAEVLDRHSYGTL